VPTLVNEQMASAQQPGSPTKDTLKVREVTGKLGFYNTITVEVENLSDYLKQSGRDGKKFILYLDWRQLKGINSRLIEGTNKLQFDIKRTFDPDTKAAWDALLSKPLTGDKNFTYLVPVSVGYENENPILSDIKYPLLAISKTWFWISVAFFVFALGLFLWLVKTSSLLRDPCPELPTQKRPYSLGCTQMAFWTFIVAVSYVFIWMVTSDRDALTESVLVLLGISAATALGAAVVGSSKSYAAKSELQDLELEKATLVTRLNELRSQIAASTPPNSSDLKDQEAEKIARLDLVEKEIQALTTAATPQESKGFLKDILNDANGISLHRFQMAIWTVILFVIFLASVYNTMAMPQFSGTLLALMGISGGTYIGFKFPEK
jgi:hypothetical protein